MSWRRRRRMSRASPSARIRDTTNERHGNTQAHVRARVQARYSTHSLAHAHTPAHISEGTAHKHCCVPTHLSALSPYPSPLEGDSSTQAHNAVHMLTHFPPLSTHATQPLFPADVGLFGCPTTVTNVETVSFAPTIYTLWRKTLTRKRKRCACAHC